MAPVSYTHLDVYKRQAQRRAARAIAGYVQSNSPNGKFGSKPALRVRDAAADNLSYLKFDVTCLLYTSRCV